MQKLRPPAWRRSRTPTPIESLGASGASASLDLATPPTPSRPSFSIDVEGVGGAGDTEKTSSGSPSSQPSFLRLPHSGLSRRRTRSFDLSQEAGPSGSLIGDSGGVAGGAAGGSSGPLFGMLRRSFSRHSSTSERGGGGNGSVSGGIGGSCGSVAGGSVLCVHCLCAEEYERIVNSTNEFRRYSQGEDSACLFERFRNSTIETAELDDSQSRRSDSSCDSVDPAEDESDGSRLSFLGESFECRQKVEPWIQKNQLQAPDTLPAKMQIRRGRSLGLAGTSVTISEPNLRRGGSECKSGGGGGGGNAGMPAPEEEEADVKRTNWHQTECGISFNISLSSTSEASTNHQLSPLSPCAGGGRRSPAGGTPRLERQSALCGWMESEPSLDLLTPYSTALIMGGSIGSSSRQVSMETHASISLEVDSGASVMQQTSSFESQYSGTSLDVNLPDSQYSASPSSRNLISGGRPCGGGQSGRLNSLESQTSVDSMASSVGLHSVGSSCGSLSMSLLARRKCLSAGASPNTSPPISRYNSSAGAAGCPTSSPRLNLNYTAGSSSEGNEPEVLPLSPSPPAEIYLAVPVLTTTKTGVSLKRHQSSSSDRDGATSTPAAHVAGGPGRAPAGPSYSLRPEMPLRSRSVEVALPTAHHRTEYHDLAGSARRQQWVSRLKYAYTSSTHILHSNAFVIFFFFFVVIFSSFTFFSH